MRSVADAVEATGARRGGGCAGTPAGGRGCFFLGRGSGLALSCPIPPARSLGCEIAPRDPFVPNAPTVKSLWNAIPTGSAGQRPQSTHLHDFSRSPFHRPPHCFLVPPLREKILTTLVFSCFPPLICIKTSGREGYVSRNNCTGLKAPDFFLGGGLPSEIRRGPILPPGWWGM